jgi:hypothetical protein
LWLKIIVVCVDFGRNESPFYKGVLPFLIVRAFSPCKKRDIFPGATLRFAPGWYKSAPLALNGCLRN